MKERINSIVTIINLIVAISLGVLGYRMNSNLSEVQFNADRRIVAKETKDLWDELAKVQQNSISVTSELQGAFADYSLKTVELFNAIGLRPSILGNKELIATDPVLMPAYLAYIGAYGKILFILDKAISDYDNVRLKFSPLVKELHIVGWEKFFYQADEVNQWKQDILNPILEINKKVYAVIHLNKTNISDRELKRFGHILGEKMTHISRPVYYGGIQELKKDNYAVYEKIFKKTVKLTHQSDIPKDLKRGDGDI